MSYKNDKQLDKGSQMDVLTANCNRAFVVATEHVPAFMQRKPNEVKSTQGYASLAKAKGVIRDCVRR